MGGGSGRLSLLLKLHGFENVILFDKSKPHIERARELGITAKCSNFHDFNDNEKYDLIIANEILQFISLEDLLIKTNSLLKEDGFIMVNYINPKSIRQRVKLLFKPESRKHQYFHPFDFNKIWNESGFAVTLSKSYMWQVVGAHSNSILVYIFAFIEKILFLSKYISGGPWIICSLKKVITSKK